MLLSLWCRRSHRAVGKLRKVTLAYVVNHAYAGLALWVACRPDEARQENELAISRARKVDYRPG